MTNRKTSTLLWLVIALVISVAAMAIVGALTFSRTDISYGMMGGGDWGWSMAFMVVPTIILIIIIAVAISGLDERPAYNTCPAYIPPQPNPLEIMNQRLAGGEVSQEE